MTELKADTDKQIRDLTGEEINAVNGGAILYVNPGDIHGFNPQPDPPAMPIVVQFAH